LSGRPVSPASTRKIFQASGLSPGSRSPFVTSRVWPMKAVDRDPERVARSWNARGDRDRVRRWLRPQDERQRPGSSSIRSRRRLRRRRSERRHASAIRDGSSSGGGNPPSLLTLSVHMPSLDPSETGSPLATVTSKTIRRRPDPSRRDLGVPREESNLRHTVETTAVGRRPPTGNRVCGLEKAPLTCCGRSPP
jgi:hypothetical protein